MVGSRNGEFGSANRSIGQTKTLEGLCAGNLVDQMQVDVQHRLLAGFAKYGVIIPDFLEHRARRLGGRGHKIGLKWVLGSGKIQIVCCGTGGAGVLRLSPPGYPLIHDRYFSLIAHFRIGETMSNHDSLHDRGNALENQFFADLDAKLLAELKTRQEHEHAVAEFSRLSGIQDTKILDAVHKLGVTPQTFSALRVFPLVAVAWGDGTLEEAERATINMLASTHIPMHSPASQMLDKWLQSKPTSEMFDAWESYARALVAALPAHDAMELKKTLVKEIQTVATSSGGLLGWAAVSQGEHKVMQRIEAALTIA